MLILPLATLEEQGIYALAANYGGLVARMVFQPIEIACRNLFANLCAAPAPSDIKEDIMKRKSTSKGKKDSPSSNADSTAKSSDDNIVIAAGILTDILRAYATMSTVCFALGPSLAPLLLRLIAGSRWTDSGAGAVLGTYALYIPFLAINGVSEAFVAATASTADLRNQTIWMAGFSILFGASAWLFLIVLECGAQGFILANCINMALRIAFNLYYIKAFFRQNNWVSMSPSSSYLDSRRIELTST